MVRFPKNMVDTDQTDLRAANNPRRKGVMLKGVDMARERMRRVPIDDGEY